MKTYWNLTDRERATLPSDELDILIKRHLAEEGIPFPRPYVAEELLPVPEPDLAAWTFKGVAFTDAEDAKTVARLCRHVVDYDYKSGYENVYLRPLNSLDTELKQALVYTPANWMEARSALVENKERADRNKQAELVWKDEVSAFEGAKGDILSDYRRCVNKLHSAQVLVETYNEYLALADGDEATACRFLVKRYPNEDLAESFALAGAPLPLTLNDEANLESRFQLADIPPATDEGLDRLAADLGVPPMPEPEPTPDPFT